MRFATIILISGLAFVAGCERSISLPSLDKTASDIFDGTLVVRDDGQCTLDGRINVIDNTAYVTSLDDGTKLILFRTWRGKSSNLRGYLYTNGPPLVVGSEIELVTFRPTGPEGGSPIGRADVFVESEISPTCYRVSRSLD